MILVVPQKFSNQMPPEGVPLPDEVAELCSLILVQSRGGYRVIKSLEIQYSPGQIISPEQAENLIQLTMRMF